MDGYALLDVPRTGAENMALDQQMLELSARRQCLLLRVYRWASPTLSLGYFQHYAQRDAHAPSQNLALVRRATGGGAIVHHFDWTYCVTLPSDTPSAIGASQELYDCMHDATVDWLRELGYRAAKWTKECTAAPTKTEAHFLCFERRSCGDVVVPLSDSDEAYSDAKVMGSAQRRMRGGLLQHGSLLLATSPHAPSLPGLSELRRSTGNAALGRGSPSDASLDENQQLVFFDRLCDSLARVFEASMRKADVQDESPWSQLLTDTMGPATQAFSASAWTHRR